VFGGGIYSHGTLTFTDSTISGNEAANIGSGIVNKYGSLTLNRSGSGRRVRVPYHHGIGTEKAL